MNTEYNPSHLFDILLEKLRLKNDAALARALEVSPPTISKIRHGRQPVGATLLIRIHEVSDISIRDLRDLMGDRRGRFRQSGNAWTDEERAAYRASKSPASS